MNKKHLLTFILLLFFSSLAWTRDSDRIKHDTEEKTIFITDDDQNISLLIDYSNGCKIIEVNIRGENVISPMGVYTAIETDEYYFGSDKQTEQLKVKESKDGIEISNINYGETNILHETWRFVPNEKTIQWTITRKYNKNMLLEDMSFPVWNFSNLSIWKGGIFDNGGMVWCKYLGRKDTYGVHTAGVTFWNPENGHAFRITPKSEDGKHLAAKYTQNETGEFACTQYVTDTKLAQRYDLNRFVNEKQNVFAPFNVKKGEVSIELDLQYVDYNEEYSRGTLSGIDATAVRELMNTTGRYGVVDNNIIGANGWITNWKCLHEPFFAQIGMALNDDNYTKNFSSTLDQERDLAMQEDGRVLSRWHGVPGDEIPGTYNTQTGYYEAMWGYTIDSQTGYIINTAEQFNLCGDVKWLKAHKLSCEKALDWLIRRDTNNNGIFEMMNNNISEKKASDWLDIVWAGFENAFVNAQMYEALNLWADCEKVLGDTKKSSYYLAVAAKLKNAFNKPVGEGGFWQPEKKQYVYWRDNDGSIHGDNLVTPVNFAAVAFGICDDPNRIADILGQIERKTVKEKLFHWPLCFDSFKEEEVHANNWPFPKYENGDIFPTWGYLGVRAYVGYNKAIALKYIHNILKQYNKDGLSSQRYSRTTQLGLGTDILAGISTTVTALYRDIYGIRPKWNRMGLEPNMSNELNGTEFSYVLRNTSYNLRLSVNDYEMSTESFSLKSKAKFGAAMAANKLVFYPFNKDEVLLTISRKSEQAIDLEINEWEENDFSWTVLSNDNYQFTLEGLNKGSKYELIIDDTPVYLSIGKDGKASFSHSCKATTTFSFKLKFKEELC